MRFRLLVVGLCPAAGAVGRIEMCVPALAARLLTAVRLTSTPETAASSGTIGSSTGSYEAAPRIGIAIEVPPAIGAAPNGASRESNTRPGPTGTTRAPGVV